MKSLKVLAALASITLLVACNQNAPAPAPAPEAPAAAPAPAEPAPAPAERMLDQAEVTMLLTQTLQKEYVKDRGELELKLTQPWKDKKVSDEPITVKIIGFNDFHGNLQSPGTFGVTADALSPKPAVGGADYLAGYVAQLKATNPNTVVVGAGDLIGASTSAIPDAASFCAMAAIGARPMVEVST